MSFKPVCCAVMCGLSLASILVGCVQRVPQAEVFGEVTLDGEPVAEAQVYLSPKASAKRDVGVFSASVFDGTFEIPLKEGPPPGEYEVFLQPVDEDAEELAEQLMQRKGRALAEREQFRAAVARKGPIRVELAADEVNEISIQLTTR